MMNYVAFNVTSWLVKGPVKDPDVVRSADRPDSLRDSSADDPRHESPHRSDRRDRRRAPRGGPFPLDGARVHARRPGPKPASRHPRRFAGRAAELVALLLSGAFAGLAGANDVLGVQGLFKANWDPGYGFTAFALVYLARLNSLLDHPVRLLLLVPASRRRIDAAPRGRADLLRRDARRADADLLRGRRLSRADALAVARAEEVETGPANAGEPPARYWVRDARAGRAVVRRSP